MTEENKKILTLGEFRQLIKDLPDTVKLGYHGYYKGCCLSNYLVSDHWIYPKDYSSTGETPKILVLNPGDDYDSHSSRKT